jgi:hypothetical protein
VLLESGRDVPMMVKNFAELFDQPLPEFIGGIATGGLWSAVDGRDDLIDCQANTLGYVQSLITDVNQNNVNRRHRQ